MEVTITPSAIKAPTRYVHTLSMLIRSFKGRRDVEVHLFRSAWEDAQVQAENWDTILGCEGSQAMADPSRDVVMEAFTDDERDQIINYLKEQYSTRLTAIRATPLSFPVPLGLTGLSRMEPGKTIGIIDFVRIPSYSLEIPLKGFYDLSLHPPLAEDDEDT